MNDKKDALNDFREFVKKLPQGGIQGENKKKVMSFLFNCWDDIEDSNLTSMSTFKLHRIENLTCIPPNKLEFDIERHGGTVMGSVWAEVYHWTIDLTANGRLIVKDFWDDKIWTTERYRKKKFGW